MALTSFRSIVLAAAAVAMTISTSDALSSYLSKIPNGDLFSQELGHPDNDSSQYTDFATAFSAAGYTWSALCEDTFPGSTMTNGQAFGDPCCTWTVGGTPDFTVTAFTTSPTEATTCASSTSTASSAAAETTEETEAPATETEAPATETEAPATEETEAPAAETTEAPAAETEAPAAETTEAPAAETTTTAPSTSTGGCRAKTPGSSTYSFRH